MKFFNRRSSNRWTDPSTQAKSGITCIVSENRVYSIHKHLDLSHMSHSSGNHQEEIKEPTSNKGQSNDSTILQHVHEQNPLEQEIDSLKKLIVSLQESKREVEEKLSIYNVGLKQQESVVKEHQNMVEVKTTQIEILSRKIEYLEDKNRFLESLASEHAVLKSEMELAKLKMKELKSKIQKNWRMKREALARFRQRMATQRSREAEMLSREFEMMKIIEGLRGEITELKKTNLELLNEKIEMIDKLDCVTESVDVKKDTADKAIQEANRLRIANGELQKQIDLYRSDRRSDIEEVIYLRWINACLKHELQKKHGSRDRSASTIKHDKRDVDGFGVNNQKNCSGYDSDGLAETEAFEYVKSKKRNKSSKTKLLLKIKSWINNKRNNKKINDEGSYGLQAGDRKIKAHNSNDYANVSSCGRMDYAADVKLLLRSRDFILQTVSV